MLNLDSFPLFIDEAFTIARARDVWVLQPFGGVAQGKPLLPWVVALVYPFGDAVFAARAITLVAGLPGVAALIALTRSLYDRKTGLAAGLVYALLPYTFFFGRFAMSDVLAANWGVVAAWGAYQIIQSKRPLLPIVAGAALAAAILGRLPMLVFAAVPFFAWLIFSREAGALRRMLALYLTTAAILLPVILIGLQGGDFGLGRAQATLLNSGQSVEIANNASNMMLYIAWYMGISLMIAAVVGVVSGWDEQRQPTTYALALFLLPTVPIVFLSSFVLPRYYVLGAAGLVMLAVSGIWWLANRAGRWNIYTGLILLIFLLYPFQRFIPGAYIDPTQYRLIPQDQFDYVQGNTAGFGLVDAVSELRQADQPTVLVCSARVTCDRLSVYLDGEQHIEIVRQDVVSPDWLAEQTADGYQVMLAQDDPPHSTPFDITESYRVQSVAVFERPSDETSFQLSTLSLK